MRKCCAYRWPTYAMAALSDAAVDASCDPHAAQAMIKANCGNERRHARRFDDARFERNTKDGCCLTPWLSCERSNKSAGAARAMQKIARQLQRSLGSCVLGDELRSSFVGFHAFLCEELP